MAMGIAKDLVRRTLKHGYAVLDAYHYMIEPTNLKNVNPKVAEFLIHVSFERWTRAFYLANSIYGICGGGSGGGGRRRRGTGGGCWSHQLVVFVVALVCGVCGGCRWCQYMWCLWNWLVVFVVVVATAEKRYENNIEEGGKRSIDSDKENKSEKEEELESEKEKEKEDDYQHDDNETPMGHELISTSQHDPVKTFSIDRFFIVTGLRFHHPEEPPITKETRHIRSKAKKHKEKIDGLFDIARHGYKSLDLLTDLMDKTIPKQYREQVCLVSFAHSIILVRDVSKVIEDDLLMRAGDFDKFNNYPWGYDSFHLIVQYLLTNLSLGTTILYGFSWAFMAWAFEVISPLRKQVMDYSDEVSHPRMFRWLATKSNTKIKAADLFNSLDDAVHLLQVVHPWIVPTEEEPLMTFYITLGHVDTIADPTVELIRKELARATAIRRAAKQGHPNGPFKKVDIYAELDAKEKKDLRQVKSAKPGAPVYPRKRKLMYPKAYDAADRIIDLEFYKKLKDKYNQLNNDTLDYGARFDFLASMLDWDEENMIKYVSGERLNPHGKS
ncbi:hypothetical protein FXO37_02996 [Capsicum annuum]|nr:hypothetical protein FXO37_02996 [Capsicum annuum]